jgi:peptide/nickel transport system ATP-binding protein
MTVRRIIGEPLIINGVCRTRADLDERIRELLSFVGLLPEYLNRYPYAFSGGSGSGSALPGR